MKRLLTAVTALSSIWLFSCCGKDDKPEAAGKGGSTSLMVRPKHHDLSKPIAYCTVYIKYNTLDAPANGIYDDSIKCSSEQDTVLVATFDGLKNGNYYLFGRGYDSTIQQVIRGGLPATITEQGKSMNVKLAVGEE